MLSYISAKPIDLYKELMNDVYLILEILEKDKDSQCLRRSLVKAIFSFIECSPYVIKFKIRKDLILEKIDKELNPKELNLLFEDDKEKENKTIKYRITFLENFKMTYKLAKKVWNIDTFDLKTNGNEYQNLLKAISIRDRLTHPKRYDDINITPKDIVIVLETFEYVETSLLRLFKQKGNIVSLNKNNKKNS